MLQLTMWYLLNVYMCEKVHVRACMQCRREFAKCRFTHFPSFFSVHVDTYAIWISVTIMLKQPWSWFLLNEDGTFRMAIVATHTARMVSIEND